MKKEILLSISILISNRPDTVEKCLKSLSSLREKVPCELILTDTGCGEHVRKMIEPYADILLDFEWCNDFSKARNLGLSKASGEWVLYLDDDEWFEDTKEIEEFFLSGEYKDYTKGFYIVRNYKDRQGVFYDNAVTPRMAKLGEEVRFHNAIHEGLAVIPGKAKVLDSFVHHYGYAFESEAEKYKHAQRNLSPLLQEYKANPYNLQYVIQIAQEYNSIREYRKSIEISLQGIQDFSPEKTTVLYLNALCINIVERYVRLFLYEDAVLYAEKYLKDKRIVDMGKARILAPMIISLYHLKRYEECEVCVNDYVQIYRDYLKNSEIYQEQSAYMMYGCFTKEEQSDVFAIGIAVNLLSGNYDKAEEIFEYINIEENIVTVDTILYEHAVNAFVKAEGVSENHPCVTILNKLLEWSIIHPKLITCLEETRKKDEALFKMQKSKWQYLRGDCWYVDYLNLNLDSDNTSARMDSFRALWRNVKSILPKSIELGVWEMAAEAGVDMGVIIEELPYYKWSKAVNAAIAFMKEEQRQNLDSYLDACLDNNSSKILCWKSDYYHKLLSEVKGELSEPDELTERFICFAESSITLARRMYHEDVLVNNQDMLPEYMQAAVHVADLFRYVEEADFVMAIRELKAIKEVLPSVLIAVKHYTKWIEKQVQEQKKAQEASQQAVSEEMQQLAVQVKAQIKMLINQKLYSQAKGVLDQLKALVPVDGEMTSMEQCIIEQLHD